jgi:hypothetical protein
MQVKPPRTVFLNHPMGNSFGHAGDAERQRQVLINALTMLVDCDVPGELRDLSSDWGEPVAYRPQKRDPSYQQGQ